MGVDGWMESLRRRECENGIGRQWREVTEEICVSKFVCEWLLGCNVFGW